MSYICNEWNGNVMNEMNEMNEMHEMNDIGRMPTIQDKMSFNLRERIKAFVF